MRGKELPAHALGGEEGVEGMSAGGLPAVLMKRSPAMPDAHSRSSHEVISIHSLLVESYNRDLERIGSVARVALPIDPANEGMLSLHDDEGAFLTLIPVDTAPAVAAIAFSLHSLAFARGVRAGEEAAFARLRYLIGAASA
ncbi:hypothetical protein LH128_15636 [Sphingomonas sp. LH128]|nr:hypothetical protein LH128_15636 [Sphingomonas sp. LH128]